MKCPYCNSPGFPRNAELYTGESIEEWVCIKCPNPVTYSVHGKGVSIWALYNGSWYSIVYLSLTQQYFVQKEDFELRTNPSKSREEYIYTDTNAVQIPSEQNITPTN